MSKKSDAKETLFTALAPPGVGYYKLVINAARVPKVKAKVVMPVVATFLVSGKTSYTIYRFSIVNCVVFTQLSTFNHFSDNIQVELLELPKKRDKSAGDASLSSISSAFQLSRAVTKLASIAETDMDTSLNFEAGLGDSGNTLLQETSLTVNSNGQLDTRRRKSSGTSKI